MRITSWNARGLNAPSKKRLFKQHLKSFNSEIILIQETKLNKVEGDKFNKMLGVWKSIFIEAIGASGGLGIVWNPRKVSLNYLVSKDNWLCANIQSLKSETKFVLINVYGPNNTLGKKTVWAELGSVISEHKDSPIVLGGDFNTILSLNEKVGGAQNLSLSSTEFKSWIDEFNLLEIPTSNGIFTWNNRRKDNEYIAEKLDRFFIVGDISSYNKDFISNILPFAGSDHFPICLEISEPSKPQRNPFKCEKMWFQDLNFLELIKTWWTQANFVGSKMFIFISKLKLLKENILRWNRDHFNNIFKEKLEIEDKLKNLNQDIIKHGMNYERYNLEKELLTKQEDILTKEEIFWRQKSREKWLEEGDRNTKFFHNSTIQKRSFQKISSISTLQGVRTENPSEIADTIVSHFKSLLNNYEGSNREAQDQMFKFIPKLVTEEENKTLNRPITLEEVKTVVFNMSPDKSPGPDGFQAFFFQKCWDILGEDLWKAIEASRNGGSLLAEINYSFFTLIPKKDCPENPGDFRPIALCNTIYKIFSKVLANRLKAIMPKLISEEQTGFVPGRSILDGILIIQETIHSAAINKEPCMFMKLDIQKAYDMVDWRFLCKILEAFGFSRQWVNLIFKFISTPKISVLINGTPEGFFEISRGIRQGDPLSPSLFILMAEAFGRAVSYAYQDRKISGISVSKNLPNITHQQYADDTILPGKSSVQEAKGFKSILQNYMAASGQKVNKEKSEIFFLNTPLEMENKICRIMGYNKGMFPCKYLGISLEKNSRYRKVWQDTIEKVDKRVGSWKNRWLSKAGKITKIRSVLSAIPIFPLACLPLTNWMSKQFESKLRNFLWKDKENDKKLALIKWDNLCKPKEYGGLGLRKPQWQNEALGAKLVWRLYQEHEHKWAKILYHKYLDPTKPESLFRMRNLPKGSECWNFIIKCRGIISKYLTWDVAAGDKALFWEDSWDGLPPLNLSPDLESLMIRLKTLWGNEVKNYKIKEEIDGEVRWRWKSIDGLDLDPKLETAFKKIFLKRKIKQSERSDNLIWAGSKDGSYSVKQGYQAIINSQQWNSIEIPLKLCWDTACLPKAGFFLWIALQNRALTADRLARFGINGPNWCVMCKQSIEDADHLFLTCPFAQNCWDWIKSRLSWASPLQNSLKGLLCSWPTNLGHGVYSKIWNICPSMVVWGIWKERNSRIFKNQARSLGSFLLKLEASIVEVMNAYLRKTAHAEGSFSLWDGILKKSWTNLINPPLVYGASNKEARAKCRWAPPLPGWHKLNFDGAARGNPGIAGVGCIVNDEKGKWIAKLAAPLPPVSNNMAELEALEKGLRLCYKLRIHKIHIEGDSQIVLNAVRLKKTPNWVLNSKLQEVLILLEHFEEINISHIYREGNSLADELANKGADGESSILFNSD